MKIINTSKSYKTRLTLSIDIYRLNTPVTIGIHSGFINEFLNMKISCSYILHIKIYLLRKRHLMDIARFQYDIENQGSHPILRFLEKHHEIEDLTIPHLAE